MKNIPYHFFSYRLTSHGALAVDGLAWRGVACRGEAGRGGAGRRRYKGVESQSVNEGVSESSSVAVSGEASGGQCRQEGSLEAGVCPLCRV